MRALDLSAAVATRMTGRIRARDLRYGGAEILGQVRRVERRWCSCSKSGLVAEVVDRPAVGGGSGKKPMGCGSFGEMGESGGQESFMDACEEHRGVQSVIGDAVAVGMGDLLDEAVGA